MSTVGIICDERLNYADVKAAAAEQGIEADVDHRIVLNVGETIRIADQKLHELEEELGRPIQTATEWSGVVLATVVDIARAQGFNGDWSIKWVAMPHVLHNSYSKVFTTIWGWAVSQKGMRAIDIAEPPQQRAA